MIMHSVLLIMVLFILNGLIIHKVILISCFQEYLREHTHYDTLIFQDVDEEQLKYRVILVLFEGTSEITLTKGKPSICV